MICGFIVAYRQYKIAAAEKRIVHERERIQKAIDLSEYYLDHILVNWLLIKHVYEITGIADVLDSIKINDIEHFDKFELDSLLSPVQIDNIKKISNSKEFIDVLSSASLIMNFGGHRIIKNVEKEESGKQRIEFNVDTNGLRYEFSIALSGILNNLEYFSMHFTHKTADESVVYQSLHVTFLEIVRLLYFDICFNNLTTSEKKLYTNVIELYNLWKNKAKEQLIVCAESDRKNIKRGADLNI